jgi:hypothetical protein
LRKITHQKRTIEIGSGLPKTNSAGSARMSEKLVKQISPRSAHKRRKKSSKAALKSTPTQDVNNKESKA